MADSETVFDAKLATFQQWQTTPWGKLRYSIAAANLMPHLHQGSRVLDVAGGNGFDAIELANDGHHVTIVDISEPALADARALAEKQGVGDQISTRLLGVDELAQHFANSQFDVVLCHNLIQYVPDPKTLIAVLAALVAPNGVVSVIAPNAYADPLRSQERPAVLRTTRTGDGHARALHLHRTVLPAHRRAQSENQVQLFAH